MSPDTTTDGLEAAQQALERGGLVVYPTDTVYGLGCRAQDAEAFERLCKAKSLPPDRGVSCVFHDLDDARAWARWTPLAAQIAQALLPGGVTLVLDASPAAPEHVLAEQGTVAIRLVDREEALALTRGGPVVSTSANQHGRPTARTIEQARAVFGDQVDAYVDVGALDGPPSTVVDARGRRPTVIREGAVREEEIVEVAHRG